LVWQDHIHHSKDTNHSVSVNFKSAGNLLQRHQQHTHRMSQQDPHLSGYIARNEYRMRIARKERARQIWRPRKWRCDAPFDQQRPEDRWYHAQQHRSR